MVLLRGIRKSQAGIIKTVQILNPSSTRFYATGHFPALERLPNNYPDWTESQKDVREAISKILEKYPDEYWLDVDRSGEFPQELTQKLADGGWLGMCMPEEYGGSNMGISEAAVMMQTISESGGGMTGASSVHMNIFGLTPVVKFGNEEQKKRMLPALIRGESRACFGVTEPNSGLDTTKLQTKATLEGDNYIVNGQKMFISTAQRANKILLLARTTPLDQVKKPTDGLSIFYTDFDQQSVEVREIPKMGRAAVDTNMLFFENFKVPAENLIGKEGQGFKALLTGLNAERILLASEALGLGYAALRRAATYATERRIFDRQIGQNQSIQHPLADSWMNLEAARLMVYNAAKQYDEGDKLGIYANSAKYLAAEAAYKACERAIMAHGGVGYTKEYHVERYMREVFIPRLTPVSQQMILNYISEKVLGQARSY